MNERLRPAQKKREKEKKKRKRCRKGVEVSPKSDGR